VLMTTVGGDVVRRPPVVRAQGTEGAPLEKGGDD
jgi:hypothetical protein